MRRFNKVLSFILTLSLMGSGMQAEAFQGELYADADAPVISTDHLTASDDSVEAGEDSFPEEGIFIEEGSGSDIYDDAWNNEEQDDSTEEVSADDENDEKVAVNGTYQIYTDGGVEGIDYKWTNNGLKEDGTLTVLTSTPLVLDGRGVTVISENIVLGDPDNQTDINVTIKNLIIKESSTFAPIQIVDNFKKNVKITIEGTNELKGSYERAGIEKNSVSTDGILTIDGDGSLTVSGGGAAAGIGGRSGKDTANIVIEGGDIQAYGGFFAAGIGGGNKGNGCNITISGGIVSANGGGAGIGGGRQGYGSNITITGGVITANAEDQSAGIGGGQYADGSNITITGGIVSAYGGRWAAGIGGGLGQNGEKIRIIGGKVFAVGGDEGAAGIGGGEFGAGCDITISGGDITAISDISKLGAGIGGGEYADGRDIIITGGNINVENSYGIGAGYTRYGYKPVTTNVYISGGNIKTPKIGTTPVVSADDSRAVSLNVICGYSKGDQVPFDTINGAEYFNLDNVVAHDDGCFYFYLPDGASIDGVNMVFFDGNGGTVDQRSKSIEQGKTYGALPVPNERKGYNFLGWFTEKEGGTKVTESTVVTNGDTHTIYAHWEVFHVKVSFDPNGGTIGATYKMVDYLTQYGEMPIPRWDGYSFAGWYTEKTGGVKITEDTVLNNTEDHTLYAHWEDLVVTVTFDDTYGNVVSANITYGDEYGELPFPETREHMQFLGWFTEKEGGKQIKADTVMDFLEDHTIYAHWKGDIFTVLFNANGGTAVDTSIKVEYGKKYGNLPTTSKEGYIFEGWYTGKEDGEAVSESDIVTIAGDHTLYAHWKNITAGSVSLNKSSLQMFVGEEAQLIATVSSSNANKRVLWSSSDDSVASVSEGKVSALKKGTAVITATTEVGGYTVTCKVTVSAVYKLTFMVDDTVYATVFVKEGQVAEKVDAPQGEHEFLGWYYNDQLWDPSSPVYRDMTLVARFDEGTEIIEEDKRSALDSQPDLIGKDSIILVKGQKFVLDGGGWQSSNKSVLAVNKKGKATAKKAASSVTLSRIVSGEPVRSISVIIKEPKLEKGFTLYVGQEKKAELTGYDDLKVFWYSAAKDIATVDSDGVVHALSKGSAVISAFINGVEFKCKVTVKDADTSKRDFSKTVELTPMQSTNIKVSGFKASAATWSSDLEAKPVSELGKGVVYENSVVRITKSGKLTAIGAGETELTATGGGAELKVKIVVSEPVTRVVHLNVNKSKTIKIYGTKGALEWIGETNGLQINNNKIKALSAGTRTITAQYENFEYKVVVYAEDTSIITTEISGAYPKYTLQMKVGQTVTITEKAVYQNILYRSNKNNIAFVNEAGVITARSKGSAIITAKANGKKITIKVVVTTAD